MTQSRGRKPGLRGLGLLMSLAVGACTPLSPAPSASGAPSPTADPRAERVADARAVVGKFLVNWRIGRVPRMLELIAPADLAGTGSDEIGAALAEFDALLAVRSLVAEAGAAIHTSRPADGVEGPQPALTFSVRFRVESGVFGHLDYRRMLTVTDSPAGWLVRWQLGLLFPGLTPDDHLEVERALGPRGRIVGADGTVYALTREDGVRVYPQEWLAGQTIGWVGTVTADEAASLPDGGYRKGDIIGRGGLEQGAEPLLRGSPGFALVARRPDGTSRELLSRPAVPGADIVISLRASLQSTAEAAIATYDEAATAVIDPNSGEVWALASAPLFNPNAMTLGTTLDGRPLRPPTAAMRTNHAVQTAYPAGSSFKPFTLAASLQLGIAGPQTRMACPGTWLYSGFTFHNYADHSLPGPVNLLQAMAFSCNTTYMPLSVLVYDADRLALTDLVAEFGFGQPTGIAYLAETPGVLPDAAYFRTHPRWDGVYRSYGPFDQIQLAIGQGSYLGTALQLANAYAAIGNGGTLWIPRLVLTASLPDGRIILDEGPREARRVSLSEAQLAYVVDSMEAVIDYSYGTAHRAFAGFGVNVAGKSGTAETGTPMPDAWFPALAPADDPQIVVATVLVHVPLATGGSDAAPLVRRVMARFFAELSRL